MQIGIIGAGPRGLVTLERLISHQLSTHQFDELSINLFDPFGIGGRVWQPDQPHELIMNTTANFISLFIDETSEIVGPVNAGPSLFDWTKGQARSFIVKQDYPSENEFLDEIESIQENDYASRALFGVYLAWFFDIISKQADQSITIVNHEETVLQVTPGTDSPWSISTHADDYPADEIIMSLGHTENQPTPEAAAFNQFAKQHNLQYWEPGQPQEYEFLDVPADENIILRGLGLSFFDAMTLLTIGRGGNFQRTSSGELEYQPSGNEPHIIAGSRRGIPLHAKGHNQKKPSENDQPQWFTPDWFANQADPIPGTTFINMVHREIEYIYYQRLIEHQYSDINEQDFLTQLRATDDSTTVLQKFSIKPADKFNWDQMLGSAAQHDTLINYLTADFTQAEAGNKTSPYSAAFDMFHDIRDQMRTLIKANLLAPDDYVQYFLGQFKSENSFLSVGPPEIRIEQLVTLIKAGIVTVMAPGMRIEADSTAQKFVALSSDPSERFTASFAVEARLPAINVTTSTNELIQHLIADKLGHPHLLTLLDGTQYPTGAMDATSELEEIQPHLYFWGIPTEGRRWFTTVSPRPQNNDSIFRTADGIVDHIFNPQNESGSVD